MMGFADSVGRFRWNLPRESANLVDESLIPAEYLIEQPAKVDKKAILAALKNGETVQGAELKESEYITIK